MRAQRVRDPDLPERVREPAKPEPKKKHPMSPPASIPREKLRKKLKEKISQKGITRKTKAQKKSMLDKELVRMGVDTKKFYESLSELKVSKKTVDAVISKT
jgi:hypothetical protein